MSGFLAALTQQLHAAYDIDPAALGRALHDGLRATRLGPHAWEVTRSRPAGEPGYQVTLAPGNCACTCRRRAFHPSCKHIAFAQAQALIHFGAAPWRKAA